MKITILVFLVLSTLALLVQPACAEDIPIVFIDATDVTLGPSVLNLSFQYDPMHGIVPSTLSIVFSNSDLGSDFASGSITETGFFFGFADAYGDLLQIDPANTTGPGHPVFPAIGSYPVSFLDTICAPPTNAPTKCDNTTGFGFTNGHDGSLTVTAVEAAEPNVLTVLTAALIALMLVSRLKK
jgi:hypothetical protein